jgi:hypothetical protein
MVLGVAVLLAQPLELCQTIHIMAERDFVILRHQGTVPMMGSCAKCQLKFFTPNTYSRDPVGAREYLLGKFDRHECEEKLKPKPKYEEETVDESIRSVNQRYNIEEGNSPYAERLPSRTIRDKQDEE